jgi:hypothetical protein
MRSREVLVAGGLLAVLLALTFWNVVFSGESLVVSDSLNPLNPSKSQYEYGPNIDAPERWDDRNLVYTPNLNDPWSSVGDWEPNGEFLRKSLARGTWPLWNPYVGAGVPDLPDPNPAYFFLPHLLVTILGNTSLLKTAYILLMVFQAGLFTFLFLRAHELSVESSFLGATAYMLGGGITQHLGLELLEPAACLPGVLFATNRFLVRPTRWKAGGLTLVYSMVSLASFMPMLVAVFGFASSYALWMILARQCSPPRFARSQLLLRYVAVIALAVGLVAFFYLPVFTMMADQPAQVEAFYSNIDFVKLPPEGLYSLLSPTLIHGRKVLRDPPMKGLPEWYQVLPDPAWLMMPAVGVVPLLLALLASAPRGTKNWWLSLFGGVFTVLLTLQLLKQDPFEITNRIPGLRYIHYTPYFGFLYNALFAILAAIGVDSLVRSRVSRARSALVLVAGMTILISLRRLATSLHVLEHPYADQWLEAWWQAVFLTSAVAVAAFVTTLKRRPKLRRIVISGLIALAFFELAQNTSHPRGQRSDVWRNPPAYMKVLAEGTGLLRVFADRGLMHANSSAAFAIFGFDSLNTFNTERIFDLYRRYTGSIQRILMMHPTMIPPEGVLDRASIGYVVVKAQHVSMIEEAERRGYLEWYRDPIARIFRRESSARYFFSSNYRVLDAALSLKAVSEPPENRNVILEQRPSFEPRQNLEQDPAVDVLSFSANGYTLSLEAPRAGLVYLSESYFPGWSATINGEPTEILRADYAFRAVEVPAGQVVIEMSYWPRGLTAGLAISALSSFVLLGVMLYPSRARRERPS